MKKLRVGLLFGGRSGEHEVSLASARSVYHALDKSRYEVIPIGITKDGHWVLPKAQLFLSPSENPMQANLDPNAPEFALVPHSSSRPLLPISGEGLPLAQLDVIIPILHGTFGEDGTIQGLLELAQIPYVGSGVLGSAVGMDKDVACRLLTVAGISTVPYLCIKKADYVKDASSIFSQIDANFSYPLFVKPANSGSSVGVHKVKSSVDLRQALDDAFLFDLKILVQKAVNARELEVSVLGNDSPRASVVGEILPRHEFYSYESKYLDEHGADFEIPAKNLDDSVSKLARDWAIKAFKALECQGLARVDFFLDKDSGKLFLNEINTIPGFTRISMYPKLWEASGLNYSALLDELIQLALDRFRQRSSLKTTYG